jgi:hypothetical protein
MHLKKSYGLKCDEKLTPGPLYKVESTLIQNISVWVHFVTKVSLVYFNLREIRNFLIPIKAYFIRKFFVTYIVVNQNFGCILGTCLWTNFQNILDFGSYNLLLNILGSRFAKF